jgi:putative sugar O-methyltransferase
MERARQHFAVASTGLVQADLPDLGPRWGTYATEMRAFIPRCTGAIEAILFAQDGRFGYFESRPDAARLPPLVAAAEQKLARRFPSFAATLNLWAESIYSHPDTTVHYNGRPVSLPLYDLMSYCLLCLDRLRRAPDVVCEIGGGYGAPARLWLTNPVHRPSRYIIVDFPESLFSAELYLVKHFGSDNVFFVLDRSVETAQRIAGSPIVLCPNSHLDMLAPVHMDLVVNTHSMQEMPEAYVDFFMDWLDRQDCEAFFSHNYAVQDLRNLHESMNTWSPRMRPLWTTTYLAHTEDPEHGRPVQQALYEKSPEDMPERQAAAAAALTERLAEPFDGAALPALLDLVRLNMNGPAILSLLRKVRAGHVFVPKEALYLVTWLVDYADRAFLAAHQKEIQALKKEFDALNNCGGSRRW